MVCVHHVLHVVTLTVETDGVLIESQFSHPCVGPLPPLDTAKLANVIQSQLRACSVTIKLQCILISWFCHLDLLTG